MSNELERGPLVVLGMHRANTSMISKLLDSLGVSLGSPENYASSDPDNQDGYWEDLRFHRISEQILNRFGGSWSSPPTFPSGWDTDPQLDDLVQLLHTAVGESENRYPWGWKDPRACLTLPFFLRHIPDLKLVVCVRNPVEVAFSLVYRRNDNTTYEQGIELWFRHYEAIMPYLTGHPSVVIHSGSLRIRPVEELQRISDFLRLGSSPERIALAAKGIRPELRRSVPIDVDKLGDQLPEKVKQLYADLCSRAGEIYAAMPKSEEPPYGVLSQAQDRIRQLEKLVGEKAEDMVASRIEVMGLIEDLKGRDAEVKRQSEAAYASWKELQEVHARHKQMVEAYENLRGNLEAALDESQKREIALRVENSTLETNMARLGAELDQSRMRIQELEAEVNVYANMRVVKAAARVRKLMGKS